MLGRDHEKDVPMTINGSLPHAEQRSVVVAPPAHRPSHRAKQKQHGTNYHQDDADGPQDAIFAMKPTISKTMPKMIM